MRCRFTRWPVLVCCVGSVLLIGHAAAEGPQPWIDPDGLRGTLVACGGGRLPDSVRQVIFERGGGAKGRLVVIPTASESAENEPAEALTRSWKELGFAAVDVLHTRDREEAGRPEFVRPLQQATAVWLGGGDQTRLAEAYGQTLVERELLALLQRQGVIAGTSAGAAIMSAVMIASGNPEPRMGTGFPLFPGAIIDQHFVQRNRQPRLKRALEQNRGLVGVGIDEGTAAILSGRELKVLGDAAVTLCLSESGSRPVSEALKSGDVRDWVALQRAARERAAGPWPPEMLARPEVPSGSLIMVGGGGMPREVTERFLELAGGPDALLVVLPTAVPPDPRRSVEGEAQFLRRAGAKNVRVLDHRNSRIQSDPQFLETLKDARGIWFGGGRQWRFIDAYEGTAAIQAFHEVLKRGGVIAGSSAGATIQGEYLCRASPLGNLEMMAEGYERGFAFLPGSAVDQHFAQRKRFPDMTRLMAAHPQFLGIGLDESTALVVRGHTAEVLGKNQVHFYNRRLPVVDGQPDYLSLSAGQKYHLTDRAVMEPAAGR